MAQSLPPMKEIDFHVIKEDWNRFRIEDGTMLKVRIAVRKIIDTLRLDPRGYPVFAIDSATIINAVVPEGLRMEPSIEPWDPRTDIPQEVRFSPLDEKWQEYHTFDGFKVLVKPVLVNVFRYNKYNLYGEPVYNANVQAILDTARIIHVARE